MKKVSIIILNWNGKESLRACLQSVQLASYRPLEIVVVDNNSLDDSPEMVEKEFPNVILVRNDKNLGYAGGNNKGIEKSTGDYIFILNNDTKVTKNFLQPLVRIMELNKAVGCVQPKIVYGGNHSMLNAVGSYFTSTGFLYHFGYRKKANAPQYNKKLKIFSAKGAGMLLRKSALKKVGLFDEDFFIFFEETDLCHRLWLAGYRVIYEPSSLIYHYEAVDTSKQMNDFTRSFLSFRNRICSYLKNLEIRSLIPLFTVLIFVYVVMFFVYFFTLKLWNAWAIVLSFIWNTIYLPKTLLKRSRIQKFRKITDTQLYGIVKKDPSLIYYYYLFNGRIQDFKDDKVC